MRFFCLLLVASCFFVPVSTLAHGDRPSLEAETGGYLIDVGYDRDGFRPGEPVTFDFDVYTTGDHPEFVSFDTVNVQILQGTSLVFAQDIPNTPTYIPSLTYTFEQAGAYDVAVAYAQSGSVKVQHTFPVTVEQRAGTLARSENMLHYIVAIFLVGFTIVAVTSSYLRRRT